MPISLDEQETVQKKTFTKWVNIYLSLHDPPFSVDNLFDDFKDGVKLIALLEVLSGQTLVREAIRERRRRRRSLLILAGRTRKKTSTLYEQCQQRSQIP